MKILICGATGFIGRNLTEHFSRLGHEVYAIRWNSQQYETPNVTWNKGDLREDVFVRKIVHGMDIIIQCAATTSGSKDIVNTPAIHVTDNAVMNSYIFRAALEAKVKHVIFFSCTTMFTTGRVIEESPIEIPSKYFGVAHTKLYCEKLCEFYAGLGETKFTVIRHSNIYGPNDKFDLERSHVMGATITKVMGAEESKKIIIWGTGEETRDLLYIDDLINFVIAVIEKQNVSFSIYNCGSGHAISVKDLVDLVIKLSGKKLSIEFDLSKPTIPTSLWLDCTKAEKELGWKPQVSLAGGIEKTIGWWKKKFEIQRQTKKRHPILFKNLLLFV